MPLYEFRCRSCDDVFALRRPMSESGDPATCPSGHADTVRLLSMFARTGGAPAEATSGGGCGGSCGCAR